MNQKGFVKNILLILLASAVLVAGYLYYTGKLSFNVKSDKTAGWEVYRSEKFGFELKYPISSEVVDQSFFANSSNFQVDVSYNSTAGGYEPPRVIISNVADSRYQITPVETSVFAIDNNVNGEHPIYFYKDDKKIYANCIDYGGLGILGFCNEVISTFKFTK